MTPAGWCGPRRAATTPPCAAFFDALGAERAAQITHVSADGADWISDVVAERCPGAIRCADPFHVVDWATEALDAEVRRQAWNDARALARTEPKCGRGRPGKNTAPRPGHERARKLKGARYALWKNPENLTDRQQRQAGLDRQDRSRLYRAYLLKEGLRLCFQSKAKKASRPWTGGSPGPGAAASRRSSSCTAGSCATAGHRRRPRTRPVQGRIESVNTKIRLLTRIAFGFRSPDALIALAMLTLGGHRPSLPGRTNDPRISQESPE